MTLKDCMSDDLDNVFFNDDEFSRKVIANAVEVDAVFDKNNDLVYVGENSYEAATVWIKNKDIVLNRCGPVVVDGIEYTMHQAVYSDEYVTQYLIRRKEAHRFD